jgi:hypothetical protein
VHGEPRGIGDAARAEITALEIGLAFAHHPAHAAGADREAAEGPVQALARAHAHREVEACPLVGAFGAHRALGAGVAGANQPPTNQDGIARFQRLASECFQTTLDCS